MRRSAESASNSVVGSTISIWATSMPILCAFRSRNDRLSSASWDVSVGRPLRSTPARAELLLQDLVDHHLLVELVQGRYWMHDLIRAYARTLAATQDPESERDDALGRLLHFYAHTAQKASHVTSRFPRSDPGGAGARPRARSA
jgi:hypothetical protein